MKSSQLITPIIATILCSIASLTLQGQAETQNPTFPFWKIKGNAGTDTASNFVGTTDAEDLTLRTNNIRRVTINQSGFVGIGTIVPVRMLELSGLTNGMRIGGLATGGSFITTPSATTDKLLFADANGDVRSIANGSSGQVLSINGSGVPAWTTSTSNDWSLTGNSGTTAGTNFIGTTDAVDFVLKRNSIEGLRLTAGGALWGSGNTTSGVTPTSGAGTRFMWIPAKAAFRAGVVTGTQWDDANIGTNSSAFGNNNTASGAQSAAFGNGNTVSGQNSVVFGNNNTVTATHALVSGNSLNAAGNYSVVFNNTSSSTSAATTSMAGGFQSQTQANLSFAVGYADTSSGLASVTIGGFSNIASADYAFATGNNNTASAAQAAAFGSSNTASGINSFASGNGNTVSGQNSVVFGNNNTVSATHALVAGNTLDAAGNYSVVLNNTNSSTSAATTSITGGFQSQTQSNLGLAIGWGDTTSGVAAAAFNRGNYARSFGEFVVGTFATNYTAAGASSFNSADRAFTVGNGTGTSSRADAFTVLKGGNVGIGTSNPAQRLHVSGINSTIRVQGLATGQGWNSSPASSTYYLMVADGNGDMWSLPNPGTGYVLASGTTAPQWQSSSSNDWSLTGNSGTTAGTNFIGTTDAVDFVLKRNSIEGLRLTAGGAIWGSGNTTSGVTPTSGAGTRLMWIPAKAAFRAGAVSGTQWDDASIGSYSAAFGSNNTVSGTSSIATGSGNVLSGSVSLSVGTNNTTTANRSIVGGISNYVEGENNIVSGVENYIATSFGHSIVVGFQDSLSASSAAIFGYLNDVTAFTGFAAGDRNYVSGQTGAAFGYQNVASGTSTFVTGNQDTAVGNVSSVFGVGNRAASYAEMAIGTYGTIYTASSTSAHNTSDRVFNVGIGTAGNARANAFTILKGGNVRVAGLATGGTFITSPAATTDKLVFADANGDLRAIANGSSGQVLTVNGSGVPAWAAASSNAWSLTGNSGTVDGTNFIGTTDNVPFNIRINNTKAGRLDASGNTVYGLEAGNAISSGTFHIAIGSRAMYNGSSGKNNIAIGNGALHTTTSTSNIVAIGDSALYSNTFGSFNTAIGSKALYSTTTTNGLTAVGFNALRLSTGSAVTAVGYNTLGANTTGSSNTALGASTLSSNTTGSSNTAVGSSSLLATTTGGSNTAIGTSSLNANSTGHSNTAVGALAGIINSTGTRNSLFGDSADVTTNNLTNATAIGWNARVAQSNSMVLGSVSGVNGATNDVKVAIGSTAPNTYIDIDGDVAWRESSVSIAPVTNNNYDISNKSFLRVYAPGGSTFTGFATGYDGKVLTIFNTSTSLSSITFTEEDAGSIDSNRITTGAGNLTLSYGGAATFQYSEVNDRWILTSYSNGSLSSSSGSTGWALTGNSGTTAGTNFIGTTDANDLVLKTNSTEVMRVLNGGRVSINQATPAAGDLFSVYSTNTDDAVNVFANGTGGRGMFVSVSSTNTSGDGIEVSKSGGTTSSGGRGIDVYMNTTTNGDIGLAVSHNGTGRASNFQQQNTGSSSPAVFASVAGTQRVIVAQNSSTSSLNAVGFFSQASTGLTQPTYQYAASVYGQSGSSRSGVFVATGQDDNTQALRGEVSHSGNFNSIGVFGLSTPASGYGYGVYGQGNLYGVYANGNLGASGTKPFMIDHPMDPEHKFLKHFAMESPEVLNAYRGNVVLDVNGEATVLLPDYFHSINKDFSYVLTPVGAPTVVYIKREVDGNGTFVVAGGNSGQKISWCVYANRNDPYLQQKPEERNVVVEKKGSYIGKYLMPALYGQPEEKGIFYSPKYTWQENLPLAEPAREEDKK